MAKQKNKLNTIPSQVMSGEDRYKAWQLGEAAACLTLLLSILETRVDRETWLALTEELRQAIVNFLEKTAAAERAAPLFSEADADDAQEAFMVEMDIALNALEWAAKLHGETPQLPAIAN